MHVHTFGKLTPLSHSLPFGGQHYPVYTAYLDHSGRYSSFMGQHAARVMDHQLHMAVSKLSIHPVHNTIHN